MSAYGQRGGVHGGGGSGKPPAPPNKPHKPEGREVPKRRWYKDSMTWFIILAGLSIAIGVGRWVWEATRTPEVLPGFQREHKVGDILEMKLPNSLVRLKIMASNMETGVQFDMGPALGLDDKIIVKDGDVWRRIGEIRSYDSQGNVVIFLYAHADEVGKPDWAP